MYCKQGNLQTHPSLFSTLYLATRLVDRVEARGRSWLPDPSSHLVHLESVWFAAKQRSKLPRIQHHFHFDGCIFPHHSKMTLTIPSPAIHKMIALSRASTFTIKHVSFLFSVCSYCFATLQYLHFAQVQQSIRSYIVLRKRPCISCYVFSSIRGNSSSFGKTPPAIGAILLLPSGVHTWSTYFFLEEPLTNWVSLHRQPKLNGRVMRTAGRFPHVFAFFKKN